MNSNSGSKLYHYTTASGLEGIVRNRVLWATDASFLNDTQEMLFGGLPLINRLSAYLDELPEDVERGGSLDNRATMVRSARNALEKFFSSDRKLHAQYRDTYIDGANYVACLTERRDQLSQWRGYGRSGYSVGFLRSELKTLGTLRKVQYGQIYVDKLCDDALNYLLTRRQGGHPGTYGYFAAVNRFLPRLAFIKHSAFEEEAEWRIFESTYNNPQRSGLKLRVSNRLIPYLELPFSISALAEVVIGPGGSFHDERAIRALFKSNGVDPRNVEVSHSNAPFRG